MAQSSIDPTLPSGRRRCGWLHILQHGPRAASGAPSPSPHCRAGAELLRKRESSAAELVLKQSKRRM